MDLGEAIVSSVWVLIPLCALAIPLVAVFGAVIVRPLSLALARLADAERSAPATDARFRELDDRLARIEHQLRLLTEQEAPRQLPGGSLNDGLGMASRAEAIRRSAPVGS